jgi:hypothetical protein
MLRSQQSVCLVDGITSDWSGVNAVDVGTKTKRVGRMTREEVIEAVFEELRRAEEKFPGWPSDPIHQAAVVAEESGELVQAALDLVYNREPTNEKFIQEAIQTTAMGLRLLFNLEDAQ